MAMLAEPRRRKRTLNLRGKNEWSDDHNKFGQKMLEKMGWAPGKGLGINLDGSIDHVKVRFKDDNGGVGYTDRNDQWTEHEDNFNGLLKSLHGGAIDTTKLHSDVSLEEKSKKSQSRVHYKKFTRGKDITRYSAKDLANIFGKKSLDPKGTTVQSELESVNSVSDKNNAIKTSDYNLIAGGSMKDYFKSKIGNKMDKKPLINLGCKAIEDPAITNYEADADVVFRGFSGTQNECNNDTELQNTETFSFYPGKPYFAMADDNTAKKPFSFYPLNSKSSEKIGADIELVKESNNDICKLQSSEIDTVQIIKDKKSKKNKNVLKDQIVEVDEELIHEVLISKSKKKTKLNTQANVVSDTQSLKENQTIGIKNSKKNKETKTYLLSDINNDVKDHVSLVANENSDENKPDNTKSKKKKNKRKFSTDTDNINLSDKSTSGVAEDQTKKNKTLKIAAAPTVNIDKDDGKSRKNKKRKASEDFAYNKDDIAVDLENGDETSIKSKKRKKNVEFALEDNKTYILDQNIHNDVGKKLKKKKNNLLGCL